MDIQKSSRTIGARWTSAVDCRASMSSVSPCRLSVWSHCSNWSSAEDQLPIRRHPLAASQRGKRGTGPDRPQGWDMPVQGGQECIRSPPRSLPPKTLSTCFPRHSVSPALGNEDLPQPDGP